MAGPPPGARLTVLWETLLGVGAGVLLLVLASLALTALVRFYRGLLTRFLAPRGGRQDLIPALSRFAAAATLALLVALALLLRLGSAAD
jgi:hypothetical protein